MATGFSAVKSGIVMFVVPFIFAFYPELLLINEAVLDPQSASGGFLSGYDGRLDLVGLVPLLARLGLALYLLSSALAGFDRRRLPTWEIALRLGLAVLLMMKPETVWITAAVVSLGLLVLHARHRSDTEVV